MRSLIVPALAALYGCSKCPDNATFDDVNQQCVCDAGFETSTSSGECAESSESDADTDADTDSDTDADADADTDTDTDADTDTDTDADADTLDGTFKIETDDGDYVVSVTSLKAFSYRQPEDDRILLVYLSSSEKADCETVGQYLSAESGDPTTIFEVGTCNILFKINSPSSNMEIELLDPFVSAECVLGSGSFSKKDERYRWSGPWADLTITEGSFENGAEFDGDTVFDFDPDRLDVTYTYGKNTENSSLVPSFSGMVYAEQCEALSEAYLISDGGKK